MQKLHDIFSDKVLIESGKLEFYADSTIPGETDWREYRSRDGQLLGIYLDVDTTAAGFTATPYYFSSLAGNGWHWATVGATSIYKPTANGFRIYLRYASGQAPTPEFANEKKWHISWVGLRGLSNVGSTIPGQTDWREYRLDGQLHGIYTDIDTTIAGFSKSMHYITSIGGDGWHWATVGATSIYKPTASGFRIYLRYASGQAPTPEFANEKKWHINWWGGSFYSTVPGDTKWQEYRDSHGHLMGIYLDFDVEPLGYENPPAFFTSLNGDGWHWATIGACAIYRRSPTGFRIYLRFAAGNSVPTPELANEKRWHVTWFAIPAWAPRAPDLTINNILEREVGIHITDKSSNEEGFELQRRRQPNRTWQIVKELPFTGGVGYTYHFKDTNLSPDWLYWYRVRVYNPFGESFSEVRQVRTASEEPALPDLVVGPYNLDYHSDDLEHRLFAYVPFRIIIRFANGGNAICPEFRLLYEVKYQDQSEWWAKEFEYDRELNPNENGEFVISEPWGFPGGEYNCRIILNNNQAVNERNMNNNTITFSFTVYWPGKGEYP